MAFTTLSDKIIFVCKEKVDIDGIKAWYCFPVNKGSDKIMETALQWARGYQNKEVKQFEYDNIEFDDVTIKELEIRGEGGRAYKVIVKAGKQNFYVDLRESCLMDTINGYGIEAGGRLKGKYIFIQEGSNMKLTLIGSEAHINAIEHEKKKQVKKISNSNLIPGHIYQNVSGEKAVFLGTRYCKNFKINEKSERKYEIVEGKIEKKLIFANVELYQITANKEIEDNLKDGSLYWFKVQSSHAFREDLGSADILNCDTVIEKLIEVGIDRNLKIARAYKRGIFSYSRMGGYDSDGFENGLMYLHMSNSKNIETNEEILKELKSLL